MSDIDPELTRVVDERINWINALVDLTRKHGGPAQRAVSELEDEHVPGDAVRAAGRLRSRSRGG
jgi:hypothetical protein